VLPCPPGFHLLVDEGSTCVQCPSYQYSFQPYDTGCMPCPYSQQTCMVSDSSSSTLVIPMGYYPTPGYDNPQRLLVCPEPSACPSFECTLGSIDSRVWHVHCSSFDAHIQAVCADGYQGRLCSQCAPNYFQTGSVCHLCDETNDVLKWWLPLVSIFVFLLYMTLVLRWIIASLFIQEILLVLAYLANIFPLWLVLLMLFVLIVYLVNALLQWKVLMTKSARASAALSSVEERLHSPLSNSVLKSFLFFVQFSSYLLSVNPFNILFGDSTHSSSNYESQSNLYKISGLECFSHQLFGTFLGRYLFYIVLLVLVVVFAFFVVLGQYALYRFFHLAWFSRFSFYRKHQYKAQKYERMVSSLQQSRIRGRDATDLSDENTQEDGLLVHQISSLTDYGSDDSEEEFFLQQSEKTTTIEEIMNFSWRESLTNSFRTLLFVLLVIFPEITFQTLSIFRFEQDPITNKYWLSDYPYIAFQLDVNANDFVPGGVLFALSVIMMVLMMVGLPSLIVFLFRKYRDVLWTEEAYSMMGCLHQPFRATYYYWSLIDVGRVFLLLCLESFVPDETAAYIISITIALSLCATVHQWIEPMRSPLSNWIELIALKTLTILFIAQQISVIGPDNWKDPLELFIAIVSGLVTILFLGVLIYPTWGRISETSVISGCLQKTKNLLCRRGNSDDKIEKRKKFEPSGSTTASHRRVSILSKSDFHTHSTLGESSLSLNESSSSDGFNILNHNNNDDDDDLGLWSESSSSS